MPSPQASVISSFPSSPKAWNGAVGLLDSKLCQLQNNPDSLSSNRGSGQPLVFFPLFLLGPSFASPWRLAGEGRVAGEGVG